MSKVSVFVGLDDHAASVQVCVLDGEGTVLANRKCPNEIAPGAMVSRRRRVTMSGAPCRRRMLTPLRGESMARSAARFVL